MRYPVSKLAALVVAVAIVMSCDSGPTVSKFGNGISGGPTGTAPVVPVNPGAPDTARPFVQIQTPATTGQLVNVGDSILMTVRIVDDRELASVTIQGMKFSGDPNLGTAQTIIRYPAITAPAPGSTPFRAQLVDTTIRRYLKPAVPIDSATDSLVILAIARDQAGNVDTARRRVQLVTGPAVTILTPQEGDSVPQTVALGVSVRVTHNAGVRTIRTRVQGEASWPASARLDTTFNDTITGTVRDVTVSKTVPVPATAPVGGRITVTASATDINSNPGSTPPVVIFVRQFGTTAPRVTQEIPERLEITDSVIINATGDGITTVGFTIRDSAGALVKDSSVALTAPFTSNARRGMVINLPLTDQGRRVRISSYAIDQAAVTGYSVDEGTISSQTNSALAFADSSLIVYGRTYALPRPGTVGDMVVDLPRAHVLISNMDANRLEVWENGTKAFDANGVAVGSQPWGLSVSATDPNQLLVANSGGTNISRVNLGTGSVATIQEDLDLRIRTRTNFLYVNIENMDAGAVRYVLGPPKMFSDRPQYIGQITDGTIFFSTRPTPSAPGGTVRYLDPSQPFPDLRTFVFVNGIGSGAKNFVLVDADSAKVRQGGAAGIPDTLYIFDHVPGTNGASVSVKSPTCRDATLPLDPLRTTCTGATDPRFDPRFPEGLPQGTLAAALAMKTYAAGCLTTNLLCSDITILENVEPVAITDTTFVAQSGDRNWIAFGSGVSSPGNIMMANVNPVLNSPIVSQVDLRNQASDQVFGLAIDRTGRTIAAHGVQTFFSAVDEPFHLRLQGIFGGSSGIGGAGVAYHPLADGNTSSLLPPDERLAFIADGNQTIQAVDIAFFVRRGEYFLKHQLYGPLRVSLPMAGDDPSVILKLYGISTTGGLTVIDLRASDILPVP